jgi:MoxR-like ATPase
MGLKFQIDRGKESKISRVVNAALLLRRPLLVTGKPGTGKSTLARAIAEELDLGEVLIWPITTRTALQDGLYHYDAIGRLHAVSIRREHLDLRRLELELRRLGDVTGPARPPGPLPTAEEPDIGDFIRLGPLGTALAVTRTPHEQADGKPPPLRPRVLLIDEIDKGDIDLPNDLLHVLEQGEFEIFELSRMKDQVNKPVQVRTHDRGGRLVPVFRGLVRCEQFPLIIMTSNGEREFPPAFLRRCLRLEMGLPTLEDLTKIVKSRLEQAAGRYGVAEEIEEFLGRRDGSKTHHKPSELSVDQLLNAIQLILKDVDIEPIRDVLYRSLTG